MMFISIILDRIAVAQNLNLALAAKGRIYQDYHTDADEIRDLMIALLGDVSGKVILEPCAGEGAFLRSLDQVPKLVDAVEIDGRHAETLGANSPYWVNVQKGDFVDHFVSGELASSLILRNNYDAVICNPPYGLRFSTDYRKAIKRRFKSIYARESYGLFMHFAISQLSFGGRYVFIVPDSFLTSFNHRPLREFLAREAAPTEIIQFKSKRFETVNFGYGNLCIIAGNKRAMRPSDTIRWFDAISFDGELNADILRDIDCSICAENLLSTVERGWVHPNIEKSAAIFGSDSLLGDIAECRTGIYTGDNSTYCGFDATRPPKRTNGHPIDWQSEVRQTRLSSEEMARGILSEPSYVPFIRGGHRKPFEATNSALQWSVEAVEAYRSNKKARLQNSQFYFRKGLAIPMVTSRRISASLMNDAVFDQGVVGVFPHDENMIDFLLVYLNSKFVSDNIKKIIGPGANNSANYVKRIPIPKITASEIQRAKELVDRSRAVSWEETYTDRETFVESLV